MVRNAVDDSFAQGALLGSWRKVLKPSEMKQSRRGWRGRSLDL